MAALEVGTFCPSGNGNGNFDSSFERKVFDVKGESLFLEIECSVSNNACLKVSSVS